MMDVKPGIPSFYSPTQVQAYLQRIGFHGHASSFCANFSNLELLLRLHLITFPYENTELHYSASHEVDVNPDSVYNRLVENRKGGTWCFGQNSLLLGMLRGLGYRGYVCSSRVNNSTNPKEAKDFSFFTHLVLIVQFDNVEDVQQASSRSNVDGQDHRQWSYLVDVGYGSTCPVRPILLDVGHTVRGAAPPEEFRLMKGMHPDSSLQESETTCNWVLQYRCGSHQNDWVVLYHFTENESLPNDWIGHSQWFSAHPVDRQRNNVICIRHFVLEEDGEEKGSEALLGRLVMWGRRVQRRVGVQSETVKEISTERERVRILKEDFGIIVDQDDVWNIVNRTAALKL